jgi:hypothetical protein
MWARFFTTGGQDGRMLALRRGCAMTQPVFVDDALYLMLLASARAWGYDVTDVANLCLIAGLDRIEQLRENDVSWPAVIAHLDQGLAGLRDVLTPGTGR